MTTHHGGVGHAAKEKYLNSNVEDTRNKDNNERTNSSEAMIALRGSEADGCLSDFQCNSQADLNMLAREIDSLQQCIEDRESQPVEGLDCTDCLEQKHPQSHLEKWYTNT